MDQATTQASCEVVGLDAHHDVEVVVHISDDLDTGQRNHVISVLRDKSGISDAEFSSTHDHLVLVRYNRDLFSSQDVLRGVTGQNLHAQLIGPV